MWLQVIITDQLNNLIIQVRPAKAREYLSRECRVTRILHRIFYKNVLLVSI